MIGMTVCSGIGAPEVAAPWIDWRWQSEIDAFPSAVLAHRFPDAVNLGDMTKCKEWPDATVDVLCGGTPCQSFSVAGLRKGLDDPRGNLMLTYLAIARRYRPRWVVWENVPGVLSSNGGRDFGAFLWGLGQLGYGFAYRVLDAQYTRAHGFPRAVPQRRRRVFVVGYLGDWRRAAAVLFDGESLRGNPPPRRTSGEGSTYDIAPCLAASGRGFERTGDTRGQDCLVPQVSLCLNANYSKPKPGDPCHPLAAGAHPPAIAIQERAVSENLENGQQGKGWQADHAYTLEARNKVQAVATPWAVRRLVPEECEALQGFPRNWTRIPYRNKPADQCPDGPRYKSLGNSWAVNCGQVIFDRLRMVEETWPVEIAEAGMTAVTFLPPRCPDCGRKPGDHQPWCPHG